MIYIRHLIFLSALIVLISTAPVLAQDTPVDIIPASSMPEGSAYSDAGDATHPPVRLTPDKSELIRLDKKAGTIIVGNPEHVSVMAESAKTLVLVPRMPGATYVTVLDQDGEVLMARHIIVASPQKKYVRIRKSCASSEDDNCQATQVYYCPDMCHPIQISTQEGSADAGQAANLEQLTNATANNQVDAQATEE